MSIHELLVSIICFLAVLLLIALSNWRALRRLSDYASDADCPPVSILVPARNEELTIRDCVQSLLAQDYPEFEVRVLDDASTDGTLPILRGLASDHPRLRLIDGLPLPAGWLGKHWACHQLAQSASTDLWLFTDADTLHQPRALRQAVAALQAHNADLVSAIPHQVLGTWGERLIVPLMSWSLFSFFPIQLAQRWPWPPLVMAVGQFMLFRREAYWRVGGHAAVRCNTADDIALARRLVRFGGRWRLLDAGFQVSCRMYRSFRGAYWGFSKSLFAAFGDQAAVLLSIWLWLGIVFMAPLVVLAAGGPPLLPALAIALTLCVWGLAVWRFRLPPVLLLLYPVVVCLGIAIALHSLVFSRTGQARWKGRSIPAAR